MRNGPHIHRQTSHQQYTNNYYQTPCSKPSTSNIISSVRRFLTSTLASGFRQQRSYPPQYQQQYSNCGPTCTQPSSCDDISDLDEVGLPLFKLCNFGVWKGAELGRGYSGVVHRGVGVLLNEEETEVKESRPMALKLSKSRTIHFGQDAFGTAGREFETLKFLYQQNVPVPRPLGFCISSDDAGNGRTLLVMELVDGQTLRDWINAQTDFVLRHTVSGRTLHPAKTLTAAIQRLDVAIGLIEALEKLHEFGVFVDLKPRNIMIGERKTWIEGIGENVLYDGESNISASKCYSRLALPVTLVDIGGVVLRRDVEISGSDKPPLKRHSTEKDDKNVSDTNFTM